MFNKIGKTFILFSLLSLLTSCSYFTTSSEHIDPEFIKIETPYYFDNQDQKQLIYLDYLGQKEKYNQYELLNHYYMKTMLYQKLGLSQYAYFSLDNMLMINSRFAPAYITKADLLLLMNRYQEAYEAYDSAVELDPKNKTLVGYRGIGMLYGKSFIAAKEDFLIYYNDDPTDPYRLLWLYFAEVSLKDPKAKDNLLSRYEKTTINKDNAWLSEIIEVIIGKKEEKLFWENVFKDKETSKIPEILCESYYYLGKYHQLSGYSSKAQDYFKLALMTNVVYFLEYGYSKLEVQRYAQQKEKENITSEKSQK